MNENLPQEQYLQIEEVWNNFETQIKKDASLSGILLNENIFSSKTLSDVIQNLSSVLQNILKSSNSLEKIQAWLYRVDVSEQSLKNKLNQNNDYAGILAELIVKRTLQKIVLRYLYKTKQ